MRTRLTWYLWLRVCCVFQRQRASVVLSVDGPLCLCYGKSNPHIMVFGLAKTAVLPKYQKSNKVIIHCTKINIRSREGIMKIILYLTSINPIAVKDIFVQDFSHIRCVLWSLVGSQAFLMLRWPLGHGSFRWGRAWGNE